MSQHRAIASNDRMATGPDVEPLVTVSYTALPTARARSCGQANICMSTLCGCGTTRNLASMYGVHTTMRHLRAATAPRPRGLPTHTGRPSNKKNSPARPRPVSRQATLPQVHRERMFDSRPIATKRRKTNARGQDFEYLRVMRVGRRAVGCRSTR